jgi:aminoglycoside phosphotransferase (APT) family kinase protein
LPPPEPRAVCHGDLHFRQLLVDDGNLTGIIDWVDVCRSDPGVDLQLVWSFLPPAAREEFLDEYGPVSEESLLRARVLALFLNSVLVRYGNAEGMPRVEAEALAGLRRASSGL